MKTLLCLLIILLIVACGSSPAQEVVPTPTIPAPTGKVPLAITPIAVVPTLATAAPTKTPPLATGPSTAGQTPSLEPAPSPTVALTAAPTVTPLATPSTTPTPAVAPSLPSQTTISVGSAQFQVEVAATPEQRSQGLSGRPGLAPGTGMLFVFDDPGLPTFWMSGMQFNLDFVWIGADCTVVDLTEGVSPPQPGQSPNDLPRYQPAEPVKYVLEINAEEVYDTGIEIGDAVSFAEELGEGNRC